MKKRQIIIPFIAALFLTSCEMSDISSVFNMIKDKVMFWKQNEVSEPQKEEETGPLHLETLEEKRALINKFYNSVSKTVELDNLTLEIFVNDVGFIKSLKTETKSFSLNSLLSADGSYIPSSYAEKYEDKVYVFDYRSSDNTWEYNPDTEDGDFIASVVSFSDEDKPKDEELEALEIYVSKETAKVYSTTVEQDKNTLIERYPQYAEKIGELFKGVEESSYTEVVFNDIYLSKLSSFAISGVKTLDNGEIELVRTSMSFEFYDLGTTQIERPEGIEVPPQIKKDDEDGRILDAEEKEEFFVRLFDAAYKSVNYENYMSIYTEDELLYCRTAKYNNQLMHFDYRRGNGEELDQPEKYYIETANSQTYQFLYSNESDSWSLYNGYVQLATAPITYPENAAQVFPQEQKDAITVYECDGYYLMKQSNSVLEAALLVSFPQYSETIHDFVEENPTMDTKIVFEGDKIMSMSGAVVGVHPIYDENTQTNDIEIDTKEYKVEMYYDECGPISRPDGVEIPA